MLTLYRTPIHGDKAAVYLEESAGVRLAEPERRILMIVPDQFSYYAEKRFTERFGGTGINGIEVMTFRQMTRRFFRPEPGRRLSAEGKQMLVTKAVKNACAADGIFGGCLGKQGFYESVAALIGEWKRYGVTPRELERRCADGVSDTLSEKLSVLTEVYKTYQDYFVQGHFLDSDEDIWKTAGVIGDAGYFDGAFVWFDEFTDFLPQHYSVMKALLSCGCDVNVFVGGDDTRRDIFAVPEATAARLATIAEELKIPIREVPVLRQKKIAPEIQFLAEHYDSPGNVYAGAAGHIHIFQGQDYYSETRHAAEEIIGLIREEGYRYSDIGILCGDLANYVHFIEPLFAEYGIPYFSDYKMPVSDHPAVMVITAIFDILKQNKSYRSMFQYLRTGLVEPETLSENAVDLLENHVLKRGIRGSMWNDEKYWQDEDEGVFDSVLEDYKTKYKDEKTEKEPTGDSLLNRLRIQVITPIDRFIKRCGGRKTVAEQAKALFDFCEEIHLYEAIQKKIEALSPSAPNEAAQFERVWTLFCQVLDQAVISMGEDLCTAEEFGAYVCQGLAACEIRIIPTGIDRVSVGDADRAALSDLKALFVLGMNNGVVPKIHDSEGLISDRERNELSALGTELAPDTKTQTVQSEFKLYKALCTPREHLYLSFPVTQKDGSVLQPSGALTDLAAMFPNCSRSNDLTAAGADMMYISSPEATMHRLLSQLGRGGSLPPLWKAVSRWYREQGGKWDAMLAAAELAGEFQKLRPGLSKEWAEALYGGRNNYSVSRLETYYKCPFRYFLENGLSAREREEYAVKSSDAGDVIHWAIREYCMRVDNGAKTAAEKKKNWDNLTGEQSREQLSAVMDLAAERLHALPYAPKKQRYLLERIRRILERSVDTVNQSFQKSQYTSAGFEWKFDQLPVSDDSSVTLRGVIDRIDIYNDTEAGRAYLRIIDYKSGAKKFSAGDICNKLDLQLAVYAVAAIQGYRTGGLDCECPELTPVVSGLFYDKMNNRYVPCGLEEIDTVSQKLRDETYLDGMVYYEDTEGIGELLSYDRDLEQTGMGSYIKIVLKKDGTPHKSRSKVGDSTQINALMDLARKAVLNADREIKDGRIDVLPYRRGMSPTAMTGCKDYCPYMDVCAYDREKELSYRMLKSARAAVADAVSEYLEERENAHETMD